MTYSLIVDCLGSRNFNIQVPRDPYAIKNPIADQNLIKAFKECRFEEVKHHLLCKANANQSIFLNSRLVSQISKALKNEVMSKVLMRDSYQILYDQFFDDESKQILFKLIKHPSGLSLINEETIEKIVVQDLKRELKAEIDGEVAVPLIWIATFLQQPDLVQTLLDAEKPADLFVPFLMNNPEKGALCQNLLNISTSDVTLDILEIFISSGLPESFVAGNWLQSKFLEAVELGKVNVISFLCDHALDPDFRVETYNHPFHNYHNDFVDLEKRFPSGWLSPISLAIFNGNKKVIARLLDYGVSLYSLNSEEMNKLCQLMEVSEEELSLNNALESRAFLNYLQQRV